MRGIRTTHVVSAHAGGAAGDVIAGGVLPHHPNAPAPAGPRGPQARGPLHARFTGPRLPENEALAARRDAMPRPIPGKGEVP